MCLGGGARVWGEEPRHPGVESEPQERATESGSMEVAENSGRLWAQIWRCLGSCGRSLGREELGIEREMRCPDWTDRARTLGKGLGEGVCLG